MSDATRNACSDCRSCSMHLEPRCAHPSRQCWDRVSGPYMPTCSSQRDDDFCPDWAKAEPTKPYVPNYEIHLGMVRQRPRPQEHPWWGF